MKNIYPDFGRLLNDNINNYIQYLVQVSIKTKNKELMDSLYQPTFDTFLDKQIQSYTLHGKGADLQKFIIENKFTIQTFQSEFDELKITINRGKPADIKGFAQKWNSEELWKNPFSA